MTASRGSWFGQSPLLEEYGVGCVVKVTKPQPTEWKIDKIIKEDIREMAQSDVRDNVQSFAALEVLCHQLTERHRIFSRKTCARMRIFYQIPWTNTDRAPPGIRAAQAATMKPNELVAYQTLSKHPHASKFTPRLLGFEEAKQQTVCAVPGGFQVIVVWEEVPGLRLGDHSSSAGFWSIKSLEERNLVRECFQKTLIEICNAGILPTPCAALNLVWHRQSKTLYWVKFREFISCEPGMTWEPYWLAVFDLVKWPRHEHPLDRDWDGDTSNWVW